MVQVRAGDQFIVLSTQLCWVVLELIKRGISRHTKSGEVSRVTYDLQTYRLVALTDIRWDLGRDMYFQAFVKENTDIVMRECVYSEARV